jgi:hypothetical protein
MRLHVGQQLVVHPLRGAPQRQFAQRRQVARGEIVGQRPLGGLRHIDLAVMQPLDQVIGRQVDDLDIVSHVDHRVRHRLAHPDAGDLRDHVVQAFDMLDVQRRIDVDAAVEQFLHIEIALRMPAALGIGVGEFVDQHQIRLAGEDGIDIHLLQPPALVVDGHPRHDLEAGQHRLRFLAPVGLDHADHDIDAVGDLRMAGGQHFVGLADAGCRPQKDLQPPTRLRPRFLKQRIGRWPAGLLAVVVWHAVRFFLTRPDTGLGITSSSPSSLCSSQE